MVSRAEHRRDTLLRLGEAAIDLFEERGSAATINDIAERAEVSRRTVFRYVDGKEELAFVHPLLWFDVFDKALAANAAEPLPDRLRLASGAIAAHVDADPEPPRRAFLVAAGQPDLLRGFNSVYQRWIDRIATEVLVGLAEDPVTATEGQRFKARIIGSAVMGVVDAVTREWVLSEDQTFTALYDRGYGYIGPLLADL